MRFTPPLRKTSDTRAWRPPRDTQRCASAADRQSLDMPQAQATARTDEKSDAAAGVPQGVQTLHDRFGDPKNFINRELSWLAFNQRVLEEAQDPTQPLIERVKFLTIFSSNLDEFFEIRVAGIKQQIESKTSDVGPDGLSPTELFDRIQKTVREL